MRAGIIEDGRVDENAVLRAENRRLKAELAEWEAGDRQALNANTTAEQLARAVTTFNLTRTQARICLAFAGSPDRTLSREYLERLIRSEGTAVDVHLSGLRKELIVAGIWIPFRNIHGVGWQMDADKAEQILRAIGPN